MKKTLIMVLAALAALTLCLGAAAAEEETPVMTHEEYLAVEDGMPVHIDAYVQDTQSWRDNKITVYLADADGAYFVYNMTCSEEDAAKLVPGTKICVKGDKTSFNGEVEIGEGATFTFMEADPYIAEPVDVTEVLNKQEELIKHMNEKVAIKGVTVEEYVDKDGNKTGAAFAYKDAEKKTDDLYFKVSKDGEVHEYLVEFYLRGADSDVYKAVEALKVGDVIDLEGFLYWYEKDNLQATALTVVK